MAKRTLSDVVEAIENQTEYVNMLDDRFVEFFEQMKADQARKTLDAQEAAEERRRTATRITGGSTEIKTEDIIEPSKEAGILSALGKFLNGAGGSLLMGGLGVGAATAGIGYLISQINEIGPSMTKLSQGLEDLENTEVTGEQFKKLGLAIKELISGVGIGGAVGIRILSGAAFKDMAEGIEALDAVEFDPQKLQDVGAGLSALTKDQSILGSLGTVIATFVDFDKIAQGVDVLNAIQVDENFTDKMDNVGQGLDKLLGGTGGYFGNLLDATTFSLIDDNLAVVADGVNKLNTVDADMWVDKSFKIGTGLSTLLSETGGWFGNLIDATTLQMIDDNLIPIADGVERINALDTERWLVSSEAVGKGLGQLLGFGSLFTSELGNAEAIQMIDDNLIPLADGIKHMTQTLDEDTLDSWKELAEKVGKGLGELLGFGSINTSELGNAQAIQMIDDNLIPLADGLKYMSGAADEIKLENINKIASAMNSLAGMQTVSPDAIRNIGRLLSEVGYTPMSTQRTASIAAQTNVTGTSAPIVIDASTNVANSTNNSSVTQDMAPMPSPVNYGRSRVDAYAAA